MLQRGGYEGPEPGGGHNLFPLLSMEFGKREAFLLSSAQWFRQEQILGPLLKMLSDEGEALWAFKGFDLARSVYPFPEGRPMGDADLYVEAGNLRGVLNAFRRCGWSMRSPGDGIFFSGIISEMKMEKHGIIAELHTHIFYFPATFPGRLPADMFENGRPLGPGLKGFSWHNALLMVLIHMLVNADIRPYWWVDAFLLCGRTTSEEGWGKFARNAAGTRLGHSISSILAVAAETLDAPVPEAVIRELGRCDASRELILERLKTRRKAPSLLNMVHLQGWKRLSWIPAVLWNAFTQREDQRGN